MSTPIVTPNDLLDYVYACFLPPVPKVREMVLQGCVRARAAVKNWQHWTERQEHSLRSQLSIDPLSWAYFPVPLAVAGSLAGEAKNLARFKLLHTGQLTYLKHDATGGENVFGTAIRGLKADRCSAVWFPEEIDLLHNSS